MGQFGRIFVLLCKFVPNSNTSLEVSASIGIAWRHQVLLRSAAAMRKTASNDNQRFC